MRWLNDLANYYAHNQPNQTQLEALITRFGDEPEIVMKAAVIAYQEEHQHFPQIATLKPFVTTAQVTANVPSRTSTELYRLVSKIWPLCARCGERTPDRNNCPFCKDLGGIKLGEEYECFG